MADPVKVRLVWEKDTVMNCYKPTVVLRGLGGSILVEGKFATEGLIEALQYTVERMAEPPLVPQEEEDA